LFKKDWGKAFDDGASEGYKAGINLGSGRIDAVDDPFTIGAGGVIRWAFNKAAAKLPLNWVLIWLFP
jgi:hypothetical protein